MTSFTKKALLLTLSLISGVFFSCNKSEESPTAEISNAKTTSLTSSLSVEGLRRSQVFDYKLFPQGGGRFMPRLDFKEGTSVKVLSIIRNKKGVSTQNPVILTYSDWTYRKGNLIAQALPISMPQGTDLSVNPDDWYMYCLVGVDSQDNGKTAEFCVLGRVNQYSEDIIGPVPSVYTSKSWTPLKVKADHKGIKHFEATESALLQSRGAAIMVKIKSKLDAPYKLQSVKIGSELLSFGGFFYNLDQVKVGEEPKYTNVSRLKYPTFNRLSFPQGAKLNPDNTYYCMVYSMVMGTFDGTEEKQIRVNLDLQDMSDRVKPLNTKTYSVDVKPGYYYGLNFDAELKK